MNEEDGKLALLSTASAWRQDPAIARIAAEALLARDDLDAEDRQKALQTSAALVQSLPQLAPSTRFEQITPPSDWDAPFFNPSIANHAAGYQLILRQSNFPIIPRHIQKNWKTNPDGVRKSINHLVLLDAGFNLLQSRVLRDSSGADGYATSTRGLQDCRLFLHGGNWLATATSYDRRPTRHASIVLVDLDGDHLTNLRLLSDPGDPAPQKNWMPLTGGDELRFMKWLAPLDIVQTNTLTGETRTVRSGVANARGQDLRGGSQWLPVVNGWLSVMHKRIPHPAYGSIYIHRFVRINQRGELTHISLPFCFFSRCIEYCAGMAISGDTLILSFGFNDRSAHLAILDTQEAMALLLPVNMLPTLPLPSATRTALRTRQQICSVSTLEGAPDEITATLSDVVNHVDQCLVLATGASAAALDAAYMVAGAKLIPVDAPFNDLETANFRFLLGHASLMDADWAIRLQPGERLQFFGNFDLRRALADTEHDILRVWGVDENTATQHCFRLAAPRKSFERAVSVIEQVGLSAGILPGGFIVNPAPLVSPRDRPAAIDDLRRRAKGAPSWMRPAAMLADLLAEDGQAAEALAIYRLLPDLKGARQTRIWSCYQAARLLAEQGDYADALDFCNRGLELDPSMAELATLAARVSLATGSTRAAIGWADLAVQLGDHAGVKGGKNRLYFRDLPALYEQPYLILRHALTAVDDAQGAAIAAALAEEALAARSAHFPHLGASRLPGQPGTSLYLLSQLREYFS